MHIIGVTESHFSILSGEEKVKVTETSPEGGQPLTGSYENPRPMTHAFCVECGCFIYQRPQGASFRALSRTTFHIEGKFEGDPDANVCGTSCMLPPELLPKMHVNYENRVMNHYDDLPKYRTFGHRKVRLTNEGEVVSCKITILRYINSNIVNKHRNQFLLLTKGSCHYSPLDQFGD